MIDIANILFFFINDSFYFK